jgi:hypothetical protein
MDLFFTCGSVHWLHGWDERRNIMDMHTIALIRALMLVGMICPLVIAGVVAAIRETRDASNLDADAPARPRQRPVVIRAVVATRRVTRRGQRMVARLLFEGQRWERIDAVRAQPWT